MSPFFPPFLPPFLPLTLTNFSGCPCLRIGIKAEERPFDLRALVDGKQVFAQRIDATKWWDLKVDLPRPAGAATRPAGAGAAGGAATTLARQKVILELVCPEDQPVSGNVWIEYADFFVN